MEKVKKVVRSVSVSEDLWDRFQITTNVKNETMSQVIEDLIMDYCIKNKVDVNEKINDWWNE